MIIKYLESMTPLLSSIDSIGDFANRPVLKLMIEYGRRQIAVKSPSNRRQIERRFLSPGLDVWSLPQKGGISSAMADLVLANLGGPFRGTRTGDAGRLNNRSLTGTLPAFPTGPRNLV
jgi:hypothetical protein